LDQRKFPVPLQYPSEKTVRHDVPERHFPDLQIRECESHVATCGQFNKSSCAFSLLKRSGASFALRFLKLAADHGRSPPAVLQPVQIIQQRRQFHDSNTGPRTRDSDMARRFKSVASIASIMHQQFSLRPGKRRGSMHQERFGKHFLRNDRLYTKS
jgi:hypothetical protein